MVSITGIANSMLGILKGITPVGVKPILFWTTLLLSFAVIFVLLEVLPMFSGHKGIRFIVAGVISYFVAGSAFATIVISKLFPNVGLALMAILGLLLVVAMLSPESVEKGKGMSYGKVIIIAAFLFVIWMTYSAAAPQLQAAGFISEGMGTTVTNEDFAILVVAGLIIGGLYFLLSPKKDSDETFLEKLSDALR